MLKKKLLMDSGKDLSASSLKEQLLMESAYILLSVELSFLRGLSSQHTLR
jgi:hypothetical protein